MRRLVLLIGSVAFAAMVLSSTTAIPVAASPRAPTRQACSDTQSSTIAFASRGVRRAQEVVRDDGRIYTVNRRVVRSDRAVSRVNLRVWACKDPSTGAWKTLEVQPTGSHHDLDHLHSGDRVKPIPADGSYGWGVYARKVESRSVAVFARVCQREPRTLSWIGVTRGVRALPWPGRYAVKVGSYIVQKSLPKADEPTYWCGEIGTATLGWRFGSGGKALHLGSAPRPTHHVRSYACRTMSPSVDSCQDQHTTTISFSRI